MSDYQDIRKEFIRINNILGKINTDCLMAWKTIGCPMCGSENWEWDDELGDDGKILIEMECKECGYTERNNA